MAAVQIHMNRTMGVCRAFLHNQDFSPSIKNLILENWTVRENEIIVPLVDATKLINFLKKHKFSIL